MAHKNITVRKEFKAAVREHILENLSEDHGTTLQMQLQAVVDEFRNWYHPHNQKRLPNLQEAFIDFMRGVPGVLDAEIYYTGVNDTMTKWFESCGVKYEDKNAYTDKQYVRYLQLIYRELLKLFKENGVEWYGSN